MAKLPWVAGVCGGIAVIFTAGNLYADKKLKAFYQEPKPNSNIFHEVSDYSMGMTSGTVKSTINFAIDPCNPNQKISVDVIDHISRGLFGYTINSEIVYPEAIQSELNNVFGDQKPLNIKSTVSWLGNVDVDVSSPPVNVDKETLSINSKGVNLSFNTQINDPYLIKDLIFNTPSLTIRNNSFSMAQTQTSAENVNFKINKLHMYKALDGANVKLTIGQYSSKISSEFLNQDKIYKDIHFSSETNIRKNLLNIDNQFKIGQLSYGSLSDSGSLNTHVLIKDVDAKKLQEAYNLLEKTEEICQPDFEQKLQQAFMAVLGEGFTIESKSNQINLGKHHLTADFSAKLDKASYRDLNTFINVAPLKATANGHIETSKAFVFDFIKAVNPDVAKMPEAKDMINQYLMQFQQEGKLKIVDDQITSKFEFKYGSPHFLNQ